MTRYVLSQQVEVGIGHMHWVDLTTEVIYSQAVNYARKILDKNPTAVLALRFLLEEEIPIPVAIVTEQDIQSKFKRIKHSIALMEVALYEDARDRVRSKP